jgi:hypothetical protein
MSARQMDCKQRNRLPGRQTDFQADRRTARQTDGMSGWHMDWQDTQTARQAHGLSERRTDCMRTCLAYVRTAGQEEGLLGRQMDCQADTDCLTGRRPPCQADTQTLTSQTYGQQSRQMNRLANIWITTVGTQMNN